ncbi:MAG: cysteine desulfurase [Verrucomicrobiales bacterium]|jgi:cysteine desulfurase
MIYLDNNATTQIHPEVLDAMLPFLTESWGNPSAAYSFGKSSKRAIDTAREQVAALIEAEPSEIVFTSCGTESITTALNSARQCFPDRRRIVTTTVEHSATKKPCTEFENEGFEIVRTNVDGGGLLDLDEFKSGLKPGETALASVIWANNETGVISPVLEAATAANEAGSLFHTDAVQAIGKVPVSVKKVPAHLLSLSGHKLHAQKGIGALFVSRHIRFRSLLLGGGQEENRRSGTENVAGIVGLGKAAELATGCDHAQQLLAWRDEFEAKLQAKLPEIEINGDLEQRLPNTANLYFPGVDAEALLVLLDEAEIYASPGSACSTGSLNPSPVLTAMGMSEPRAKSSIRFSFSRLNSANEVDEAVEAISTAVARVRSVMNRSSGPVAFHS